MAEGTASSNNFLTNINETIQKVLEARQSEQARKSLSWFRDRRPWARATSLVSVDHNYELRKNWILFSGTGKQEDETFGLREFYDPNDFNKPLPGLTEINVKNKGSFGSTREAVFKFNCWTLSQLDIMEKLYMSLGMPVLLEWGWNIMLDGTPVNDTLYLENPSKSSLLCIDNKIKKLVDLYQGHYDGMIGLVTDFNWTLRDDGGFDCSVTLISQGEMYLSINTKSSSKQIRRKQSALFNYSASDNLTACIFNLRSILIGNEPIKGVGLKFELKGIKDRSDLNHDNSAPEDLTQYFLTWRAIEKILERNLGYTYSDGASKENCDKYPGAPLSINDENEEESIYGEESKMGTGIESFTPGTQAALTQESTGNSSAQKSTGNSSAFLSVFISSIEDATGLTPIFAIQKAKKRAAEKAKILSETQGGFSDDITIIPKIDNSDLAINYIYGVRSINPNICILPIINDTIIMTDDGQTSVLVSPFDDDDEKKLSDFKMTIQEKDNFPNVKILLSEVLVNMNFFYETIKSTSNLSEVLFTLLNGISEACGDLWKFQIMIDEDRSPEIRILETQSVSTDAFNEPTYFNEFKVYDKDSAVRSVNLSTDVSSEVKNKILLDTFNSNKEKAPKDNEQVGFIHYYDAKVQSLLKEKEMRGLKAGEGMTSHMKDIEKNYTLEANKTIYSQLIDAYKKIRSDGYSSELIEETLPILKAFLAKLVHSNKGDKKVYFNHKNFMVLPLNLSLTIDGIAGLKWGNKIRISYIPERYKSNTAFSLVNITHTVTPEDWTCELESIFRIVKDGSNEEATESPIQTSTELQTNEGEEQKAVIILDSAHGIGTAGKRSPDESHFEFRWSRQTVDRVSRLLENKGFLVYKTNTKEADISGKLRKDFAEDLKDRPKIFLSFHNNAAKSDGTWSTTTGSEVWIDSRRQKDKSYAEKMYDVLKARFPEVRFRPGANGKVKEFGNPSDDTRNISLSYYQGDTYYTILIEWLFQDNKQDVSRLKDPQFNFRFAQAVTEGVEEINKMF